jgi:hypothetical protein
MARRQFFRLAASISTAIWPDRCFSRFHHAGFTTSITTADDSSSTGSAKEDAVLPPKTVEWPLWHDDPWRNEHGRGDPVPQRHDIELARYVEKQRACREPNPPGFGLAETVGRLWSEAQRIASNRLVLPRWAARR